MFSVQDRFRRPVEGAKHFSPGKSYQIYTGCIDRVCPKGIQKPIYFEFPVEYRNLPQFIPTCSDNMENPWSTRIIDCSNINNLEMGRERDVIHYEGTDYTVYSDDSDGNLLNLNEWRICANTIPDYLGGLAVTWELPYQLI